MSRTSKALKRLGVAGVAVATIGAGVPALIATSAQAATGGPTTTLTIQPASQEGAAGTCLIYSVTPQNSTGGTPSDTQGQTIQVTATPTGSNQVQFCNPTNPDANHYQNTTPYTTGTGATQTTAATQATPNNTVGTTANSNGTQTFGVRSNAPGGATIRAYIGAAPPIGYQAGNPTATATATFTAGGNNQNDITSGGNGAQDAVKTITATNANSGAVAAGQQQSFTVQTLNANNEPVSGVTLSATFNSGSANTNTSSTSTTPTPITCVSGGNAAGTTTQPSEGSQTGGSVTNNAGYATCSYAANTQGSDTVTVYVNQTCGSSSALEACEPRTTVTLTTLGAPNTNPAQARNIALTPQTQTAASGGTAKVTATVTDAAGKPVQNVNVTFHIRGTVGTFSGSAASATAVNGCGFTSGTDFNNRTNDTYVGCTNAQGQVVATVGTVAGETGQIIVDGTINQSDTWIHPSATNECTNAAGTPTAGSTAGNCTDTAVVNVTAASPSPSGTATPTPSSSTPSGRQALTLVVNTPTINAGTQGKMTATGAANQAIQLVCYTRPSTTYKVARNATINAAGDPVVFTLSLGMNTRCFAQYATNSTQGASPSGVINVKTVVSIFPVRNSTRNYTFQGHNLPKYAGQLITLYYVNSNGDNVRKGFVKTDSTGIYHIPVTFVSSGTFTFFVRTGQTLTNAAGESAHVAVNIH